MIVKSNETVDVKSNEILTPWMYNDQIIDNADSFGFVYIITNLVSGRKYIGKKQCIKNVKLKPLKGKTRCRRVQKESDWRTYKSSCNQLLIDISTLGIDNFKFEIVKYCNSKSQLAYYEAKMQFDHDVLLHKDEYYNAMINLRLNSVCN